MATWRSKASTAKTVFTVFNKEGNSSKHQLDLFYGEVDIKYEKNPKFLGVTLDPALNLHTHAEALATRCYKTINVLRHIKGRKWGASSKLIIRTYKALIRPVIDYSAMTTILMADTNRLKLEKIQRAAVRTAFYWPLHTRTEIMYDKAKLTPLMDRALQLTDSFPLQFKFY